MHQDLQNIFSLAISRSKVDFGISEGHRPVQVQQQYYAIGRTVQLHRKTITNVDGVRIKGKHNYDPSEAGDIYIYHPDKSTRDKIKYSDVHMAYIAGLMDSCAEELFAKGEITHKIRWGGNWDGDGIIALDQSFDDLPHFELIKP